jgi:uncharacterized protein YeaO (DUF488 family)
MIKTEKSVYDKPEASDGKRILVMRIWPRGISKEKVDEWVKDLGTEKELMKKWKAGGMTWSEYSREYEASLKGKELLLRRLAAESRRGTVTLLCGCKDKTHCHRQLLKKAIESYLQRPA